MKKVPPTRIELIDPAVILGNTLVSRPRLHVYKASIEIH